MLLLFTRLREDRPLYKRDLLDLSCRPPGSLVQYSYQHKYVDASLLQDAKGRLEKVKALVVFIEEDRPAGEKLQSDAFAADERARDAGLKGSSDALRLAEEARKAWADWARKVQTFHPIREVTIAAVEQEPGTINLKLELERFVDYGIPDSASLSVNFTNAVKQLSSHPSFHRDEAKLVVDAQLSPSLFPLRPAERHEWTHLAEHLVKLRGLEQSVLFVVEPDGHGSSKALGSILPAETRDRPDGDGHEMYRLASGRLYKVKLNVIYGATATRTPPTMQVHGSVADVLGPVVRQRNSGEEAVYLIAARPSLVSSRGWLWVRADSAAAHSSSTLPNSPTRGEAYRSPELVAFLETKPGWSHLSGVVALFVIGTVIASLSSEDVQRLGADNSAGFLALVSKLVGAVMLGYGAVLGFKRMPPDR